MPLSFVYEQINEVNMFELILTSGMGAVPFVPPAVVPGTPYKGFVKSSDLVRGDSLATLVGLADGTAINPDGGWMHYIDGEYEFYIARLPIRYGMSAASLTTALQDTGKTVTISGKQYKVRMMTGMSVNPFSNINADATGGEWNKYMHPIYGGADRPVGVQWSYYTNADLGFVEGTAQNGTISLCADKHNTLANCYAGRGRDYGGGTSIAAIARKTVINDANASEGNGGFGRNAYGWRPILDFIPPPPTLVDTWENLGTLPVKRNRGSAVAINDKIYIYAGYDETSATQGTLHMFDPADKSFTAKLTGTARGLHDAVAIGGKMYVMGGLTSGGTTYANDVTCYDPVANTWTPLTTNGVAATARARHKMIVDGTGFIVVGGLTTGGGLATNIQRFETTTNAWTNLTGTFGSQLFSAADAFGTVYLSGGYNGAPLNTFSSYTVSTGAIATKAVLPSTRYGHVTAYAKTGVYVFGGVTGAAGDAVIVQRYTPGTNSWVNLGAIPFTMVDYSMACVLNGAVYIFGGNGATNQAAWKYNP